MEPAGEVLTGGSQGAEPERSALGLWQVQHRASAEERVSRTGNEGGEFVGANDRLDRSMQAIVLRYSYRCFICS